MCYVFLKKVHLAFSTLSLDISAVKLGCVLVSPHIFFSSSEEELSLLCSVILVLRGETSSCLWWLGLADNSEAFRLLLAGLSWGFRGLDSLLWPFVFG